MAWNFLQIVEFGAESDDLYPVPTGRGIGFELSPDDTNPATSDITGLKVNRQSGEGPWVPSLNVLGVDGTLLVTDRRIVVTFGKFVPKDQSSFEPVVVMRPDGRITKRPKRALVGHLLMSQVRQIGVRGRVVGAGRSARVKSGDRGHGSLIVSATDGTGGPGAGDGGPGGSGDHVAIEIILAAGIDPVAIGNDVLSRSALAKVTSPLFSIDETVRQQWTEMIRRGFSPSPGEVEYQSLSPFQVVRVTRPVAAQPSLTPPTDTSPVPTMWPTPAVPMPSLAHPQAPGSPAGPIGVPAPVDPPTRPAATFEPSPPASLAPTQPAPAPARTEAGPHDAGSHDADSRLPEPLVPAPPPPGSTAEWRPDPFERFELRFWDGFGWTEHVHSNGDQRTDPPH